MSLLKVAEQAVALAKKAGAAQAEAFVERTRHARVKVRGGEVEELTEATSRGVGLRVVKANRLGFAHTTSFDKADLRNLAERAVALAQVSVADDANKLPRPGKRPSGKTDGLFDEAVLALDPAWKLQAALAAEKAARGASDRITNIEESSAGDAVSETAIASTEGVRAQSRGTYVFVACAPIASDTDGMQVGSWYDQKRFLGDLESPEQVGRTAAQRAVRMLGARQVPSARVPVVFEPTIAASLVAQLAAAFDGDIVRRRSSFLAGKLGKKIAPPLVTLVDDALLERGLGSSPFDGEGVPTRRNEVIAGGVLRSFLYDTTSARRARAKTTANASRGYATLPAVGTHNFHLAAGKALPEVIVSSVKQGLYVTSMLGRGANIVSGDYSRGAQGLWIEDGELAYPVQEITVAGNLGEMLMAIDAVGTDLEFRSSYGAPTIRFAELTVSGG